ncbi:MAG: adenine deaminase [Lachnospiraceae bacterium]|nr:adenine deaminase [Lachnospiraceae bacterium]
MTTETYTQIIQSASGVRKADLVLKNVRYLNVFTNEFLTGDIAITNGRFAGIGSYQGITELDLTGKTIVPGFIDGHIHLESTAVRPEVFAREALLHGTTAVITDPHEITNVLGTDGVDYMLQSTQDLPMDVFFMMPSCVPSCPFDESGAEIDAAIIKKYLENPRILGLAEMMNAPGITFCDADTLQKTKVTLEKDKLIDGHAPGLAGNSLMAYTSAGIYSDHECTTPQEAIEKIQAGQWIMIREGTASKNLQALLPLCREPYAERCMFATDDRHIDDIINQGYIDYIIRSAIAGGVRPETAYKMASFQAASYFRLSHRGAIAPGYLADFVVLDDVKNVSIHSVYKNGIEMTPEYLKTNCTSVPDHTLIQKVTNTIHLSPVTPQQLELKRTPEKVIGLVPGQLITTDEGESSCINVAEDILKVCVVERHKMTGHIGVCFIRGYGLKSGAIATSVAHDSHNIIVVGTNEEDMAAAINAIRDRKGGMVVINHGKVIASFALPIAGLMSEASAGEAKASLLAIHEAAYSLGANRNIDPFMTLSFVSLPVIPKLKLTTLGVVDVEQFQII